MTRARLVTALAAALAAAVTATANAYHPVDAGKEPTAICSDLAAGTIDIEHDRIVPEPPLPTGVRRARITVDGIGTVVHEAGPGTGDRAVVFLHGYPGSSRDWDDLLASTGRYARAVSFDFPGLGQADDGPAVPHS